MFFTESQHPPIKDTRDIRQFFQLLQIRGGTESWKIYRCNTQPLLYLFSIFKTRSKFDRSSPQSTWDIFIPHFVLQMSIIGSLPLSRREQKHDMP